MSYIDFVFNIVGLLLWINWRSLGFVTPPSVLSVAAAIKPAGKQHGGRWVFLAAIPLLLLVRSLFYWQVGAALGWTPQLFLGVLVISFPCNSWGCYMLFSLCSFALLLLVFYYWLLLLAALNYRLPDSEPWQKLVRLHLGWLRHWPALLQLLLPFTLSALAWLPLRWLLEKPDLPVEAESLWHTVRHSLGFSLATLVAWKYLLLGLLLLHLLNTYVYLGASAFWNFITATGRNLLVPFRWLRWGKLDLAPVVGIVLVVAVTEIISRWPNWLPDHKPHSLLLDLDRR